MPMAVAIGVIGGVFAVVSASCCRATTVGTIIGMANGIADQSASHPAHCGTDQTMGRKPAYQCTRTGTKRGFRGSIIIAGGRR